MLGATIILNHRGVNETLQQTILCNTEPEGNQKRHFALRVHARMSSANMYARVCAAMTECYKKVHLEGVARVQTALHFDRYREIFVLRYICERTICILGKRGACVVKRCILLNELWLIVRTGRLFDNLY